MADLVENGELVKLFQRQLARTCMTKGQKNFKTQFDNKLASVDQNALLMKLLELIVTEKEKMEEAQERALYAGPLGRGRWRKRARKAEESKYMAQAMRDVCDGVCSH